MKNEAAYEKLSDMRVAEGVRAFLEKRRPLFKGA